MMIYACIGSRRVSGQVPIIRRPHQSGRRSYDEETCAIYILFVIQTESQP